MGAKPGSDSDIRNKEAMIEGLRKQAERAKEEPDRRSLEEEIRRQRQEIEGHRNNR